MNDTTTHGAREARPVVRCGDPTTDGNPVGGVIIRAGGDTMGFEMSRQERTDASISARRLSRNRRGTGATWRVAAIFAALGASILVILGAMVYYGYIGVAVVGNYTYGELIVFGILLAAAAIAFEVVGRER